jgi:hypothetical protein
MLRLEAAAWTRDGPGPCFPGLAVEMYEHFPRGLPV